MQFYLFTKKIIYKFLSYFNKRFEYKYRKLAFLQNSHPGRLEWDWKKIHFNRIALVNLLVSKKDNCSYLEIGCASNSLFDSVPVADKTGVDPKNGGNIRKTSDDFFTLNNKSFDVIFIDGLHTYEQVHRDVENSIKCLKAGGWIALHDLLPRTWEEHHVPMVTNGSWTGDVWKVAFELSKSPGVDFKLLAIDHGVGVFRLTSPQACLIDLHSELIDKQFGYLYENLQLLPITSWDAALPWLKS